MPIIAALVPTWTTERKQRRGHAEAIAKPFSELRQNGDRTEFVTAMTVIIR